jgi:hypothetical protein
VIRVLPQAGALELFRGPPVPPQIAPSVFETGWQLLEWELGAAHRAELIITAATVTIAVLIPLAFMTSSPAFSESPLGIIASAYAKTEWQSECQTPGTAKPAS